MSLRFHKSITVMPGVKLNLSKTGASISVGTKGLHANLSSSGRVTGTASLPGTGISYRKSASLKSVLSPSNKKESSSTKKKSDTAAKAKKEPAAASVAPAETATEFRPAQLSDEALRGIHKAYDEAVDWLEFSQEEMPAGLDPDIWAYYHEKAPAVLNGDLDAYLQVIEDVCPLDDLLDYGGEFQFGTDRASLMEVEFTVNEETLETQRREKNVIQFCDLLQDYVCSTTIRIARDMFALLPVADVVVHAVLGGDTVLSVRFDRDTMDGVKFGFVDPSDVMARFEHKMDFRAGKGFSAVERIDSETI